MGVDTLPVDFGRPIAGVFGLSATGTTQTDAALLKKSVNVFSDVPVGSGAVLPGSYAAGTSVTVMNRGVNALLVYPPNQDQIEENGSGVPVEVLGGQFAQFCSFEPPLTPAPRTWWIINQATIAGLGGLAYLSAGLGLTSAGGTASVAYGFNTGNAIQGGSQPASFALAAPTGSAGVPSWRQLAYADISGLGSAALLAAGGADGAAVLDGSGYLSANSFISTGTTTARSLAARGADWVNVKDYGAVLNGSTSDSAAFQSAYDAVPTDGVINIPAGNLDASLTSSASKSVLWRTLGSFDYSTSAPGTNPVTSFGDGDVLETFLGGRKRFSKSCVTNQEAFATVEVDLDWSSTNPDTSFVNSALVVAGTNNATGTSGGVWSGNFFVTANTAISDNYAIAGTATINGTGWAGAAYLQLMDNAGTSGDVNVHEFDLFTQNSDPIGTSGPISGLRAVGSWNLATVAGKTTAQASRGLSVGTSGSASIGSVFFTGGNIYNAAFDCAQATFTSSSVAALRMAPNQFIDLTGDYATGALNAHALGYSTSSTSLEYRITGTAVFLVKDSGEVSAAASASDPAFNVFGSGVVGFDTANATLTNSIRMGADQTIAWESSGAILTRYDSTALAWQYLNGGTVEFQIGTGGNIKMLSGATLQIGSAYTAGTVAPTGYMEITDSSGTVRKVPCL